MGLPLIMFILELTLLLILYITLTLFSLRKGPRGLIQHYPPEVQTHAVLLARVTRGFIITKEKLLRPLTLLIYSLVIILLIVYLTEYTGYASFFFQTLIFLELINWFDGILIECILLRHCKKLIIPGTEEMMKSYSCWYFIRRKIIYGLMLIPYAAIISSIVFLI